MEVIILARSSQNYSTVTQCLREVSGITELRLSASVTLVAIMDPSLLAFLLMRNWRNGRTRIQAA
jgi:hypothetical protein